MKLHIPFDIRLSAYGLMQIFAIIFLLGANYLWWGWWDGKPLAPGSEWALHRWSTSALTLIMAWIMYQATPVAWWAHFIGTPLRAKSYAHFELYLNYATAHLKFGNDFKLVDQKTILFKRRSDALMTKLST